MSWREINRKAYERVGKAYDTLRPMFAYSYLSRYFSKFVKKHVRSKSKVLDMGCGTGNSTHFIDRMLNDCEIHGVDQAESMINAAKRKRFRNIARFFVSPIERFKRRKRYDAVFMFQVIHHFKDTGPVLRSIRKNSRKGTKVFLIDYFLRKGILPFLNWFYTSFMSQGKYSWRSYDSMERQLRKHGYKVIGRAEHPFLSNYGMIVAKV